ncbi:MAG: hypothetical protein KC457_19425 [Myxococcales bacterium]|nr:hypothetical protein [Myxococcales bacterium]
MEPIVDAEDQIESGQLYRHSKRENWGIAVFLWERDEKRAFRFADGEVRIFKKGFYELMVPAKPPGDGTAAKLLATVDAGDKKLEILPSVGDQLMFMLSEYPRGFIGEAWTKKHRGRGRRLKRHRDAAITEARELLEPKAIAALHEAEDHAEVLARWIKVLAGTDLVPSSHIKKLEAIAAEAQAGLSETLVALAQKPRQEGALRRLQAALVSAHGPATSWQVLTATLSLLDPVHHVCVRPSVFATQGAIVVAGFRAPARANEAGYQRYLEVARLVQVELAELGHSPTDMFDVYDFVWTTLRPAARAELTESDGEATN